MKCWPRRRYFGIIWSKYAGAPALAAMVMGMFVLPAAVFSSQATLLWDRSPGSASVGYRLYYGNTSRDYRNVIDVDNQTSCTVADLAEGIAYFFAVTAYDQYGNESEYSEEVSQTIYEDAEDPAISGWDFCGIDPGGAVIDTVFDDELQRTVIDLRGTSFDNCYRLQNPDFTPWNNSAQLVLAWTMKSSESFRVAAVVATTVGILKLGYVPFDTNWEMDDVLVSFGLGAQAMDGQWHHFGRNLQADLDWALPGIKILKVKRLLVRGSGRLTDIKLLSTPL